MALTARDIMETQVITLSPSDPLFKVEQLFYEEEIHGAPVIGDDGRLVGMISSLDLLRAAAEDHDTVRNDAGAVGYVRELIEQSPFSWVSTEPDFEERLGRARGGGRHERRRRHGRARHARAGDRARAAPEPHAPRTRRRRRSAARDHLHVDLVGLLEKQG